MSLVLAALLLALGCLVPAPVAPRQDPADVLLVQSENAGATGRPLNYPVQEWGR